MEGLTAKFTIKGPFARVDYLVRFEMPYSDELLLTAFKITHEWPVSSVGAEMYAKIITFVKLL